MSDLLPVLFLLIFFGFPIIAVIRIIKNSKKIFPANLTQAEKDELKKEGAEAFKQAVRHWRLF